jgi:hypothetical protein
MVRFQRLRLHYTNPEALQGGLIGHHAAGGRGNGAVRDATGNSRR